MTYSQSFCRSLSRSESFASSGVILICALIATESTAHALAPAGGVRLGGLLAAGGIIPVSGNAIQACSRVLGYLQGGFGTLAASVAGMGAIVSAALGGFKAAWSLLVIGVGTFILRTFLTLFMTGC